MKTLETERMILRDWAESDLDDFAELWTNPNVTVPQGDPPMKDKEACRSLLQLLIGLKNNYALELKETGKVIGSVGLNEDADDNPDGRNVGYIMNEAYWNRGYMQEALKAVIDHASKVTSFLSAAFFVGSDNPKSRHIVEKMGFRFVKTITFEGSTDRVTGEPLAGADYYVLSLAR